MWDTLQLPARGNFSLRKIALLFVTGILSVLFVTLVHSTSVFADDAILTNDTISYNGHEYKKSPDSATYPGLDAGPSYIYKQDDKTAFVIAYKDGIDLSKPNEATLKQYKIEGDGSFSNADPPNDKATKISLVSKTVTSAGKTTDNADQTSCGVKSIGWLLCGVTRFMAGAVDKAYEWVNNFLVIKPLTTDTDSGLFQAWDIARGIANACFIVAFLVIVYSQITSVGINNYEIKKMIPRLIIAAILVNASYYICTIAVDISNIMGDSIQKALIDVRESMPAPKAQTTWGNLTDLILSGGTLGAAGALAIGASGGVLALVPLLIPVVIGAVLSIFVALMVLAARQALMTVLIVLAPIAFVAYLLPNTEKQFERWRGLFVNMLMIFPLFSLLFGGSQLASYLIIQNTDQISVVILAMAVQVAPLAITPFLLKVSHNLLTQLGGFMNNPKKGLVDRSRNWANERSELNRERHNARGASKPWYTSSGLSYRRASGKLRRQNNLKRSQEQIAAAVANEERSQKVLADIKEAEFKKSSGDAIAERMFEQRKVDNTGLKRYSSNLRLAQMQTKTLQEEDETRWQEALSKKTDPNDSRIRYGDVAVQARAALHAQHIAHNQKEAAENMQKSEFVAEVKADTQAARDLQRQLGGIDPNGAINAYARAKSADLEEKAKLVKQIEDSSPIMPGRTLQMQVGLQDAIRRGNAEEARAYINLLAKSNDPGVNTLRETLIANEVMMRNNGILDDIKNHVDNHSSLNSEAEDMVKWSRLENVPLEVVGTTAATWENQTASKILGQKQSTQKIAIASGGVSKSTMREILTNPAKVGVKPEVLRMMRQRLSIDIEGSDDDKLRDAAFWNNLP